MNVLEDDAVRALADDRLDLEHELVSPTQELCAALIPGADCGSTQPLDVMEVVVPEGVSEGQAISVQARRRLAPSPPHAPELPLRPATATCA